MDIIVVVVESRRPTHVLGQKTGTCEFMLGPRCLSPELS